jgi:hypothetical protein
MPIPDTVGAFAIVPSNNLKAAVPFWERMGFAHTGGDSNYIIMDWVGLRGAPYSGGIRVVAGA